MRAKKSLMKNFAQALNMLSIFSYMDERDIAAEILMERAVHKGSFLIVEGKTDVKRFKNFISQIDCSITGAHSVRKAKGALRILESKGFSGVLAIVDADFDRIHRRAASSPNLIVSDNHDLDIDWIKSSALSRYLDEVGDAAKIAGMGGVDYILNSIVEKLRPVSVSRYLNAVKTFKFPVSGIDVSRFFCLQGDITDHYIDALIACGNVSSDKRDWIKLEIVNGCKLELDLFQLTNGHDICCALGALLESKIGSRKPQQRFGSEVETHIRLAMDDRDFVDLSIAKAIATWEKANVPYIVLDSRLGVAA